MIPVACEGLKDPVSRTGNSYEIENIGSTDAQIVFLQGREIRVTEEVGPEE